MRKNVVSISGGKDSGATACVCFETEDPDSIVLVTADTGNEHPITYEYWDYLETAFGKPLHRLRADFTERIARKRQYVEAVWAEEGVPATTIERALEALVPSGIPFLDLCIWKGRFPSRKAQFCTQELKTIPLVDFQIGLIDQGHIVWSWQGIRADESEHRRYLPQHEEVGGGLWIERPILKWPAEATFEAMVAYGIKPNPLYSLGMNRVGCMPCINCSKGELSEIARRWPDVIDRVETWEQCVAQASKRGASSFFSAPEDGRADKQGRNIRERVIWAMTSHGGEQFDLLKAMPPRACSSSYGLCA
jgi:3'-phosphoadenosine 5'-phosphosulfate sulfotransferase (PAPS reductase)/FAD synthetase